MGVRDLLKKALAGAADSDQLLQPILASQGLEAARCDYAPEPKQVILSVKIRGVIKHIPIPTGQTLTLDQICALIAGKSPAGAAAVPADQAKPPPENPS